MPWRPVGHGVEALYLATPLGRRVGYGVYVYRYRGLLVDTGPPKARPFAPEAALLTHAHEDHAGGASRLGLPVYGSALTAALVAAPKPLRLYRRLVWGSPRPAQVEAAERVGPLHLLPTPGHAPDHVALYDPEAGLFFGGDLFLGVRASLATPGFDLQALLQSLRRALALKPRAFYCAHAGPLQAPWRPFRPSWTSWRGSGRRPSASRPEASPPKRPSGASSGGKPLGPPLRRGDEPPRLRGGPYDGAMITAFVLIRPRGNRVQALGEAIAELPQVAEVYSVTGPYDLVALVRLKDVEELDDVVTQGILSLEGVERTETLLAFRAYPRRLLDQGFALGQG